MTALQVFKLRRQVRDCRWLILVFALGMAARFFVGWYRLGPNFSFDNSFEGTVANNLTAGRGYAVTPPSPTAYHTWGYVFFVTLHTLIFGTGPIGLLGLAAIAAIGAINATLCALLGHLLFEKRVGAVAGTIYAATPYLASQELGQTGLLNLTMLLALLLTLAYVRSTRLAWSAIAGLVGGWAYLIRPEVGLVLLVAGITIATDARRADVQARLRATAVFTACVLAIVAPWVVRNWIVFDRLIPAHASAGITLWQGTHPRAFEIYPKYSLDEIFDYTGESAPAGLSELDEYDWYTSEALDNIKKDPSFYVASSIRRWLLLWDWQLVYRMERVFVGDRFVNRARALRDELAYTVPYVVTCILAAGGLIRIRARPYLITTGMALMVTYTLPHALIMSYTRYRMRLEFMLILLAAVQAVAIVDWWKTRRVFRGARP